MGCWGSEEAVRRWRGSSGRALYRRARRCRLGGTRAEFGGRVNGGGDRLGAGRQRGAGFEQRGDVTPQAGGDHRRRHCAEVAAAVQRQRRSARVVACAGRGGARCAGERGPDGVVLSTARRCGCARVAACGPMATAWRGAGCRGAARLDAASACVRAHGSGAPRRGVRVRRRAAQQQHARGGERGGAGVAEQGSRERGRGA